MLDNREVESSAHVNVAGMVEDGIRLARQGARAEAEKLFRRAIQVAPENDDGWLWMAWLADTREESLRYLREGLYFKPDSPSLHEGVAWVEAHKPAASASSGTTDATAASGEAAQAASTTGRPAMRRRAAAASPGSGQTKSRAADAVKASGTAARQIMQKVAASRPARVKQARAGFSDRIKSQAVTLISLVAIAAVIAIAMLVARQATSRTPAVSAMVLPTPVLDATATPGVENLAAPLWTKVEIAFSQEDWTGAVVALDKIRSMDPQNAEARERLSAALYERALDSIAANELELAKRDLDRAIILDADSPNLQSTRRDIELYRAAVEAYLEQDWAKAVSLLNDVYVRTPSFRDTRSMLGQAHCYLAEQQLNNDSLDEALAQATLCEEILEGDEEAAALVKQVMETIRPARRIEVTLSDFRVRIYEDNEVIKSFPICYGRPSHPTKTGRFEIQSKLENAYASTWDMDMPYWLGIYWAGGTENGFHALPILSSGSTLWAGALGTRCSFGCIVLNTPDAIWLYEWATLGTVVFVNP